MPPHRTAPTPPHRARARRGPLVSVLALSTVAATLAGCGSSPSTGASIDPARAVPASAVVYATADVRPEGSLKRDALAAGHTLSQEANPYLRLIQALQTPGSPPLDFKRDLSPWLGTQAGVFLTSLDGSAQLQTLLTQGLLGGSSSSAPTWPFGAHGLQGALVLDTRDAARARAFLSAQAAHAGAHNATYRGVAYQATSGGVALGIVEQLVVIGSDSGLRGVIDTTLGAPALAHASGYEKLLSAAPANPLAHVYAHPGTNPGSSTSASASASGAQGTSGTAGGASAAGGTSGAASRGTGAGKAQGLGALLALLAGGREVNLSLTPTATSVALDVDTVRPGSGSPGSGAPGSRASDAGLLGSPAGAKALGELPGDSWLALGLGDAGATLGQDVEGLSVLGSLGAPSTSEGSNPGPVSVNGLLEGFLKPLNALTSGAQAQHDFLSWMGSGGIFASGSGLLELKGGVVITSKNPALSRVAVAKLGALLRQSGGSVQSVSVPGTDAAITARVSGLPVVLYVADGKAANGQVKFVMGLGEASILAALNPSSVLASASSTHGASSALGEGIQPSLMVEFATLLGLLEGVGLSQDPTISKFVPLLHSVTTLAGGGKSLGGGVQRLHLVLGLQQSGG